MYLVFTNLKYKILKKKYLNAKYKIFFKKVFKYEIQKCIQIRILNTCLSNTALFNAMPGILYRSY